jgi:hypothetical protein
MDKENTGIYDDEWKRQMDTQSMKRKTKKDTREIIGRFYRNKCRKLSIYNTS